MKRVTFWLLGATVVAMCVVLWHPDIAHAASSGGAGLPFEAPFSKLVNSIKGPIAFGFSVLGIVCCGAGLIFGGDLNGFMRGFCVVVLVGSVTVSSVNVGHALFGTGATISDARHWPLTPTRAFGLSARRMSAG